MACVQCMECVLSVDAADDALGYACLRWATAKGGENESNIDGLKGESNRTGARENSGVLLFESALSTVHFF